MLQRYSRQRHYLGKHASTVLKNNVGNEPIFFMAVIEFVQVFRKQNSDIIDVNYPQIVSNNQEIVVRD